MFVPGIPQYSDRFGAIWLGLLLAVLWAGPALAQAASPNASPDFRNTPLPRSAGLAPPQGGPAALAARLARAGANDAARGRLEVGLGVADVLAGNRPAGAERLAAARERAGDLAEVAAYYQGLARFLDGDAAGADAILAGLASRPTASFLGRDALYLSLECAARLGNSRAALARAEAWLTTPDPSLAPEVWLRAAVAAAELGDGNKAQDFLRRLSLDAPWSKAAKAGDALARQLLATAGAGYDPDAPGNVLLRAEALAEKGQAEAALHLLSGPAAPAFDAPQAARAEYIRGKALYALRRTQAAAAAFARAGAANPDAPLAWWALYHQARCLWRSLEPDDAARMEALLRRVLAAPGRDDRLREAAARHLTLLLIERGRFVEAMASATSLAGLAVSPDLAAQGASLTALLHYVIGDFLGAEEALAAFVSRFPEDEWTDGARYWRGKTLWQLGRGGEATALWREVATGRPNTYYGGRSATALAEAAAPVAPSPAPAAPAPPRCPDSPQPPSATAEAALAMAQHLDEAGLADLTEMYLDFAARAEPGRADLALAHIRAASAAGRRQAVLRTAWRTFGGCLLRGSAAALAPLRPALFPRAWSADVQAALSGSDVSPDIVYSLIRQESFFDPKAVSGAGAVGLMQLLPTTAQAVGKRIGIRPQRADLFDPVVNIRLGTAFFRERLEKEGNLAAALASYNAGENRVRLWNQTLAPLGEELFIELMPYAETRDYVRRILANAMIYAKLYAAGE